MKEYRICMPLTVEEVGEVFLAFVVFWTCPVCWSSTPPLQIPWLTVTELLVSTFCLIRCSFLWSCQRCALSFCTKEHTELLQPRCDEAAAARWSCCRLFLLAYCRVFKRGRAIRDRQQQRQSEPCDYCTVGSEGQIVHLFYFECLDGSLWVVKSNVCAYTLLSPSVHSSYSIPSRPNTTTFLLFHGQVLQEHKCCYLCTPYFWKWCLCNCCMLTCITLSLSFNAQFTFYL